MGRRDNICASAADGFGNLKKAKPCVCALCLPTYGRERKRTSLLFRGKAHVVCEVCRFVRRVAKRVCLERVESGMWNTN